ncbi:hypothetical protein LOK49_LG09G01078 [Camellia lanceoleosa]|uniref:Uncharacterized protein n=1 Tax=Camellia lanceoleosa TaxID=1840588 RepID=A0ACC0GR86_9ERIC|nr:hypothetical protein LOK49_LG09G01078 [Camellia lanceoleosa]
MADLASSTPPFSVQPPLLLNFTLISLGCYCLGCYCLHHHRPKITVIRPHLVHRRIWKRHRRKDLDKDNQVTFDFDDYIDDDDENNDEEEEDERRKEQKLKLLLKLQRKTVMVSPL